jgi:hypothetical protein
MQRLCTAKGELEGMTEDEQVGEFVGWLAHLAAYLALLQWLCTAKAELEGMKKDKRVGAVGCNGGSFVMQC